MIPAETPLLAAALNKGWWVVTADYEGLDGHFTAGLQSGRATLDSLRVVLKEGPKIGLAPDARYAMWGYSGGSLACGWAAELQPSYAPELHFAGAALGGTVPSVRSGLSRINGGPFTGLAYHGINGLAKAYPNFTEWLDQNLVSEKKAEFYARAGACTVSEIGPQGAFQDIYSYFVNGESSISEPIPASVFQWGTCLESIPLR
ncbi:hypothetical protein EYZ11_008188 [Aspergillus tanneri]|uniref:Triacylglycerol lipase n=1 Tax=Aspergillus tanneri TaxID=1220188 RepID=A0A4V6RQR8_9EURO|nr:hypothetical protein EYZ11_008188 [Aspergillus tanneri]